jgi:hypothetical protein
MVAYCEKEMKSKYRGSVRSPCTPPGIAHPVVTTRVKDSGAMAGAGRYWGGAMQVLGGGDAVALAWHQQQRRRPRACSRVPAQGILGALWSAANRGSNKGAPACPV